MPRDELQTTYNGMREISNKFRTDAINLYVDTLAREAELVKVEIDQLMKYYHQKPTTTLGIQRTTDSNTGLNITNDGRFSSSSNEDEEIQQDVDQRQTIITTTNQLIGVETANQEEAAQAAYIAYHELYLKRSNLEAKQSVHFLEVQRVESDDINFQESRPLTTVSLFRQLGEEFTVRP